MPPKSEKKIKPVKEGPKKNKSSYMFFCEEERKKIKEDRPELGNKDIVVELGVRWKQLKEDESRKDEFDEYTKLAEKDKERYLKEKQVSSEKKESEVDVEKPEKKTKKGAKKASKEVEEKEDVEDEKPKEVKKKKASKKVQKEQEVVLDEEVVEVDEKPKKEKTKVNGYINYTKEMRDKVKKENPKLTPKEVTQQLSKQWKELSDDEKEKFKNK
jgi:hypothetical protein